jgi:cytochrome c oxidase cbb3-type subunit 3
MLNNNYAITFTFLVATLFFTLGPTTAQAATAKENYDRYCSQCHGTEGKGNGINATDEMPVSPRNHTDPKEMGKLTSEDVYYAIKDGGKSVGKSSLMPRWGGTINDGEIKDLVKYLNTLCNCKYKAK